jgi:hypothetical protein
LWNKRAGAGKALDLGGLERLRRKPRGEPVAQLGQRRFQGPAENGPGIEIRHGALGRVVLQIFAPERQRAIEQQRVDHHT